MNERKPGRQGLTDDDIRAAISELHANSQKISPTKVREALGTGSFTTITRVIAAWQQEQASIPTVKVPEPPKAVIDLTQQLWRQAWLSAHAIFDLEREQFVTDKERFDRERRELLSEIQQLEGQNTQLEERHAADVEQHERLNDQLDRRNEELSTLRGQCDTLRQELIAANQERHHATNQLITWIERATLAEAKVAELQEQLKASDSGPEHRLSAVTKVVSSVTPPPSTCPDKMIANQGSTRERKLRQ